MVRGQATRKPITGISSMATRQVLAELAVSYEQLSGRPVVIESVGGVDAVRRVEDGEAFDIVVLAADALDLLAVAGRVDPASRVAFVQSGIGVAVAAGQPRPNLRTEAELRDSILSARSIGYSTGPSGRHLTRLFERWGIADVIAERIVQAPPGVPVGDLVARGDVVKIVAGFRIDAAHRADHLAREQDVVNGNHASQQIDTRLMIDTGIEENVVEQMIL